MYWGVDHVPTQSKCVSVSSAVPPCRGPWRSASHGSCITRWDTSLSGRKDSSEEEESEEE